MALAVLEKSEEFVSRTSRLLQKATAETLADLKTFERQAAMAQTAGSLSRTPNSVLAAQAGSAELLHKMAIKQLSQSSYQMQMGGSAGGNAVAMLNRGEFQRIMQMLHEVVSKAGWSAAAEQISDSPLQTARH